VGAAVSVAIMCGAPESTTILTLHFGPSCRRHRKLAFADHQSHIWPRVVCGGIRACWRIEGPTGASALPRVTNDRAECCCWWEYRPAPHSSVVLHSISTSRIGCVAAPCAASLADCGCALRWYLAVETKCMQGVRRCGPLARALTCRNCGWPGNRSYLLFVAMSYAYLFKYIIIGDMGECWLPSVSPLLRLSPAVFHGVVQVWANHAFSYNSRTSDSSQFTI